MQKQAKENRLQVDLIASLTICILEQLKLWIDVLFLLKFVHMTCVVHMTLDLRLS